MLNPLLAANMGRWAEVYFTSPPEKREQAVAELIRELGGHPATERASDPPVQQEISDHIEKVDQAPLVSSARQPLRSCQSCSYENSEEQNFCGMCGSPLRDETESGIALEPEKSEASTSGRDDTAWKSRPFSQQNFGENAPEAVLGSPTAKEVFETENSFFTPHDDDLPQFAREPEPVPYRYRLYVGTILAVLLVLLVYMSWRGTRAMSGNSGTQAPPARLMPPAPSAVAHDEPPPAPSPARPTVTKSETAAPPSIPPARQEPPVQAGPKRPVRNTPPASHIVTKAANTSAIALQQSSQQDLATAEQFLKSTPRDSKQASTWLWKAVSKGNPAATLALSDLYLRGDGVPKSCDQARLLLDAAARKGQHAAAERIRNLPAFGCQ